MLPDFIPDEVLIPTEPINLKELAALYKCSVRTLQRAFEKLRVYDAIGIRIGNEFTPHQQVMIFYLYYAPGKYARSYWYLEHKGYIADFAQRYGLDKHKANQKGRKK